MRSFGATILLAGQLFSADMAGFWEFNIDLGGLEIGANCNLMENAGQLNGRCWSTSGAFRYDTEATGAVQQERIELSYSFPTDRGKITFRYKGQREPDKSLSGDFILTPSDGSAPSKGLFAAAKSR